MKLRVLLGIALAFLLVLLAACADNGQENNAQDDDEAPAYGAPAASEAGITQVARVNGVYLNAHEVKIHIPHVEERFLWEFFMEHGEFEIDEYAMHSSGVTFGRVIREEAVRTAAFYTVFDAYAHALGIILMDFEQEMIDNEIARLYDVLGEEQFHTLLHADGFRDPTHLADLYRLQILLDNLIDFLLVDTDAFAPFAQFLPADPPLLGAKHILANFDNFNTEEEAHAFITHLWERLEAGEDFDTLMHTYTQDTGIFGFPNGYSFAANEMVPEFEATTRALSMGEVAPPVQSMFGYHIIKRIEPNENDWHALNQTQPRSMEDRMVEAIFAGLEEKTAQADIVFLPALDDVAFPDVCREGCC
ncbi:MAG: peptidylprolyl isomerase [Defluviitaleaceae bacterium]|nr:peptidylprolyl isomerase [Defluviitaleaceae bacterium]MCL2276091.1 peptidylprolyl isomerase [Defluviitaleaceae bacterium]